MRVSCCHNLGRKMKNEKGILLISSFLVLAVIGTFSLAFFQKGMATYHASERTQNRIQAFHLGESGLDLAISQLRKNSSYTGQGYTALKSVGSGGDYMVGGYLVGVSQPEGSPSNIRLVRVAGQTPNDSNLINIASASPCPDAKKILDNLTLLPRAYECRAIEAFVSVSNSPFNNSLFAKTSIEMNGNAVTDSYDSRTGVVGSNGDVATNGTAAGAITLTGNAKVKGDAVVGPGADLSTAISLDKKTVIEGTQSVASSAVTLDSVQIPSNLTNQGVLSLSAKDTLTLSGGTYWYSSIDISGDAKVSFTGSATLYVSGSISVTGKGFVTAQNLPPNLLIYVQGSSTVSLAGKADFYGAVYAPDSEVTLSGNTKFFGAVVGNAIHDSGKALVRYDEALKTIQGGLLLNTVTVLAWTEA